MHVQWAYASNSMWCCIPLCVCVGVRACVGVCFKLMWRFLAISKPLSEFPADLAIKTALKDVSFQNRTSVQSYQAPPLTPPHLHN